LTGKTQSKAGNNRQAMVNGTESGGERIASKRFANSVAA
jgi:hypothetical protein